MEYAEVMQELEGFGTAQNRKVYARHGASPDAVFGVSFANLNLLAKRIKRDGDLAEQLWQSGNYDARNLACKIAEPAKMGFEQLNKWVGDVDNYAHGSFVGDLVANSPDVRRILNTWTASDSEFVKHAGYCAVGAYLKNQPDALGELEVKRFLDAIETEIHTSPNWARYGMNWALIAIGTYRLDLTDTAIEYAKRIGKVDVDHGQTSCKTPDAAPYIEKAAAHNRKMQAKRQAKQPRAPRRQP